MLNGDHSTAGTIKINKALHGVMYLLLLNLILDIIVTIFSILTVTDYFYELFAFGVQNVLVFAVLMIIILIFTIIPIIIGQNYKQWSEDKQTDIFFKLLSILSIVSITLMSVVIYSTLYMSYPTLIGPHSMTSNFYRIWWYFSFNLGPILIFLLYIYLES